MSLPLPSRHDEAWHYADLDTLATAHTLPSGPATPPVTRLLRDGERLALPLVLDGTRIRAEREFVVPEGARALLVETLAGTGFGDIAARIRVGAGASLAHVVVQDADDDAVIAADIQITLDPGALYESFVLNIGARYGRLAWQVDMAADARFDLNGIQLARGTQALEIVAKAAHRGPRGLSRQTVRAVLAEQAAASYLGTILVDEQAAKTDAAQASRALLLARTATANARPELLIYTDDVKCAHGATVGELDRQALFYLESRGLDQGQARRLLIDAFIADVAQMCPDDDARTAVDAATARWLAAVLS